MLICMLSIFLASCGNSDASASHNESTSASPEAGSVSVEDDFSADRDTGASETVSFSTVDINGDPVSIEDFRDSKVIMINFWEPWCGPCVGEMPDLEALYEKYSDDGLTILGVFSSSETEEAEAILESAGTTYPVLRPDSRLAQLASEYVPTTVFIDGEGRLLSEEPFIGSMDYDSWEEVIQMYMKAEGA